MRPKSKNNRFGRRAAQEDDVGDLAASGAAGSSFARGSISGGLGGAAPGGAPGSQPSGQANEDRDKRVVNILSLEENAAFKYCGNAVTTSKYSLIPLSFRFILWKNLFEQFQRAANLYFLAISVMQVIPGLSPTGRYTTIIPLVLVLAVTLIKDSYEDWRRRLADRTVNNSRCLVYRGREWKRMTWSELHVGDVVCVHRGEPFPADLVLAWSSHDGMCYIETAMLDGETNLKPRKAPASVFQLMKKQPIDEHDHFPAPVPLDGSKVVCELPNNKLYNFDGYLERFEFGKIQPRVPLVSDNILLRGAVLRNTPHCLGIVIFTGEDTKLMKNAANEHHKMSDMDRVTNRQVVFVFFFQIVLAIVCSIGFRISAAASTDHWYLGETGSENPSLDAFVSFFTFTILFNSLIPISLYVMLEMVRLVQAYMINNDVLMYSEERDIGAVAKTSKLNEELGQVAFIFSDKTGTLTCNKMEFRKFTCLNTSAPADGTTTVAAQQSLGANGQMTVPKMETYGEILNPLPLSPRSASVSFIGEMSAGSAGSLQRTTSDAQIGLLPPSARAGSHHMNSPSNRVTAAATDESLLANPHGGDGTTAGSSSPTGGGQSAKESAGSKRVDFYDRKISNGYWRRQSNRSDIRFLLQSMAVCHTVIPEEDQETGEVVYEASSPDEACLVRSAKRLGVELISRTDNSITIRENIAGYNEAVAQSHSQHSQTAHGAREGLAAASSTHSTAGQIPVAGGVPVGDGKCYDFTWELLATIEFSSARKRMSVVVRDPLGRLMLLTKGADNVIMKKLRQDPTLCDVRQSTEHLLDSFAADGLRTLVFAKLDLSQEQYKRWRRRFDAALTAIHDKQEKVDAVAEEIERDLELLGTTAIEDRLQENVPQSIDLFAKAGIKLWVLTGDKQETAINIGYSCQLLSPTMGLFTFDACTPETLRHALEKYIVDVEAAEVESGQDIGLVIQGSMLDHVLPTKEDPHANELEADLFVSLATKCKAVICCRVSPIQKAQIVQAVKDRVSNVTLAIGDGANDVSMIQTAHVGIGISGLEGLQAARSSDYSIAEFQFLQRLLLVHGRWSYRRLAKLVVFAFYKNMSLYMTQFWFIWFNLFTGQTLYDAWALAFYNLAFTSFPIMSLAVFDRDVEPVRILSKSQFPELYNDGLKNKLFNTREFWTYTMTALLHSLMLFYLPFFCWADAVAEDNGQDTGIAGRGIVGYTCVLVVVTIKCCLEMNAWTILNIGFVMASIYLWFVFLIVYCSALELFPYIPDFELWFGADVQVLNLPIFWLIVMVVSVACLIRDVAYKAYRRNFNPTMVHCVQSFSAAHDGVFDREDVRRNVPFLFPKHESKQINPSLSEGIGHHRFTANANAASGIPGVGGPNGILASPSAVSLGYSPPAALSPMAGGNSGVFSGGVPVMLRDGEEATPAAGHHHMTAGDADAGKRVASFGEQMLTTTPGRRQKRITDIIDNDI